MTERAAPERLIQARGVVLPRVPGARPFDFDLAAGERVWVRGASGSGKTTLIKVLAGLVSPATGRVALFGEDLDYIAPGRLLELRRRIGVAFSEDGLFAPWTVFDNLALPLRYHGGLPEAEVGARIEALFDRYGVPPGWLELPAGQLNPEQRLAVSLLRAVVREPALLLVDAQPLDLVLGVGGRRSQGLLADLAERGCALMVCMQGEATELVSGTVRRLAAREAVIEGGTLRMATDTTGTGDAQATRP